MVLAAAADAPVSLAGAGSGRAGSRRRCRGRRLAGVSFVPCPDHRGARCSTSWVRGDLPGGMGYSRSATIGRSCSPTRGRARSSGTRQSIPFGRGGSRGRLRDDRLRGRSANRRSGSGPRSDGHDALTAQEESDVTLGPVHARVARDAAHVRRGLDRKAAPPIRPRAASPTSCTSSPTTSDGRTSAFTARTSRRRTSTRSPPAARSSSSSTRSPCARRRARR